jgi:hypothetical protein
MIPGHVDGGFHAVGQANELRRPAFVMSAKAYDVYPSHSGQKILEKTGGRQEPGSTVKLAIPVDRLFWTWHSWHPYQTAMTKTRPVSFLALFAFYAVFKFKRYEDPSLSYTGINKHEGEDIGLYDTVLTRKDAQVFENVSAGERYGT